MTRNPMIGLALLGAAALSGCGNGDANHLGYVEAEWVYVAAPQAGWVIEQSVETGTRVTEGDLLFRLEADEQEATLAQADAQLQQARAEAENLSTGAREPEIAAKEARLAEARARLSRAERDRARILPLVEQGIEPASTGDQVKAEAEMARASVRALEREVEVARLAARPGQRDAADAAATAAEAQRDIAAYRLSQRNVTARHAGRVEDIFLHEGEYATPGAPVLALLPDDGYKARFFVHQSELPNITVGGEVSVSADGLSTPVSARITYIAEEAEFTPPVIYSKDTRGKLVFLVEAALPPGAGLHPGLPIEVRW